MDQLNLFQQVNLTGRIYTASQFVSNGFVAVRTEVHTDNEAMAELVEFLAKPEQLTPAFPLAQVPPVNNLPSLVMFAQRTDGVKLLDLKELIFVDARLYELICRHPYHEAVKVYSTLSFYSSRLGGWSYRDGKSDISVISVYDDGLIGFVAGMHIGEDNRLDFFRAAQAALDAEEESQ